jgi:hypothetical protein
MKRENERGAFCGDVVKLLMDNKLFQVISLPCVENRVPGSPLSTLNNL